MFHPDSAKAGIGRKPLSTPAACNKEPLMPTAHTLRVVSLTAVLLCIAGLAWGQKDTGSIVGTVRDPSGAVVADAKVVVSDVERGQTFETKTSDAGEYVASPLRVGRYTVTVEKAGFKRAVSE